MAESILRHALELHFGKIITCRQEAAQATLSVIVENAIDLAIERECPDILCSALTQDCIGRGKTLKEGGAVYDFISGLQVGIVNMADSLAAIKKQVYEEKKITQEQLMNALADDFTSPENHKDLIVRVAGYSAFFNALSRATQDDIIGRTEQTL